MAVKHILTFRDIASEPDSDLMTQSIAHALSFKQQGKSAELPPEQRVLRGSAVALLFEKPSLRTKLSFEIAVRKLGGHPIYFSANEVGLGQRESVADAARVISSMCDLVIIRTFAQDTLEQFARYSSAPVVNALSDAEHPCQALADLVTIKEHFGNLQNGYKVAYIGDGNNVAVSLAWAVVMSGGKIAIATPDGYAPPLAALPANNDSVTLTNSPAEAVSGAGVVYTDTWTSMGAEAERAERLAKFAPYRVTRQLMQQAASGAVLMHCLPAHDGEEIQAGLLSEPFSACWAQAENRLWAQLGLLYQLLRRE